MKSVFISAGLVLMMFALSGCKPEGAERLDQRTIPPADLPGTAADAVGQDALIISWNRADADAVHTWEIALRDQAAPASSFRTLKTVTTGQGGIRPEAPETSVLLQTIEDSFKGAKTLCVRIRAGNGTGFSPWSQESCVDRSVSP